MADNVNVTPGSGVIIGTRDAGGGVEIQRVIPNTWNGSAATDVSSANPMPTTGTLKDGVASNLATVAQFHNADNQAPGGTAYGLLTGAVNQLLNASGNLDRQRGNLDNISLVASAAYTTNQLSADQTNYNHKGVIVTLNVTNAGTGSITLEVDYKDPVSGTYTSLLTGAAVTTAVTNQYTVYPGVAVAANVSASMVVPRTWRVKVTANNANAITYSVGAALIV